jgi:hypothetical protein
MPSHADRVRRHCQDGDPQEQSPLTQSREALKRSLSELALRTGFATLNRTRRKVEIDV